MTDVATMTDEIMNELIGGQSNDEVRASIQEAVSYYDNQRFWFLERDSTFNTVAGQEYYTDTEITDPLISTLIERDEVLANINGKLERLKAWPNGTISYVAAPGYRGQPVAFTLYADKLRLYPVPDNVYPVTVRGAFSADAIDYSVDAATNEWFDKRKGYYLIKARAAGLCASGYLRDDPAVARYEKEEQRQLQRLVVSGNIRRGSGQIVGAL